MSSKNVKYNNWKRFSKVNWYYYKHIGKILISIIPKDVSVLEFGSKTGEFLASLPNKDKVGVEFEEEFIAKKRKNIKLLHIDSLKKLKNKKFDYIILPNTLSEIDNIQDYLKIVGKYCHKDTRVVVLFFNYLWKPLLDLGEALNLKSPDDRAPNWLSESDINNFFDLENFVLIKKGKYFLFPYFIPRFSDFINKYISRLPLLQELSLVNYSIYSPNITNKKPSVSIVIPARNESGNMKGVLRKIPKLAKKQEIIFVEGGSTDNTYQTIAEEIKKYKGPFKAKLFKQKGKGKGDAVRLGFSKADNELFMILDADLTVDPKELNKFYMAYVDNKGDFIMGSRLIYPMENEAMRTLNILGNKFFSSAFSYLLDQKIKDTLCGTKVILKSEYDKIAKNRKVFGDFDPFGDFDLIFGAAKLNLKITEIPIRYKERVYGTTNISRFTHGWLLLKMVLFAAKKFKYV